MCFFSYTYIYKYIQKRSCVHTWFFFGVGREDISKRFSFRTQINIFFCVHTLHKLGMCRFIMAKAAQKSTMYVYNDFFFDFIIFRLLCISVAKRGNISKTNCALFALIVIAWYKTHSWLRCRFVIIQIYQIKFYINFRIIAQFM